MADYFTMLVTVSLQLVVILVLVVSATTCSTTGTSTINITVEDGGVDAHSCLEGATTCQSLSYAINNIESSSKSAVGSWIIFIGNSQTLRQLQFSLDHTNAVDLNNSSIVLIGKRKSLYVDFTGLQSGITGFTGLKFVSLVLINLPYLEGGLLVSFHNCQVMLNSMYMDSHFVNINEIVFSDCTLEYVLNYSQGLYSILRFKSAINVTFVNCLFINGGLNPLLTFSIPSINSLNPNIHFDQCVFHQNGNRLNLHYLGYQSKWIICTGNYRLTISNCLFLNRKLPAEDVTGNSLITGGDNLYINITNTQFRSTEMLKSEYSAILLFRVIKRLHLLNVSFISNIGGAAISVGNGNVSLTNVSFINNTGIYTGGIIFSGTYIFLNVWMKNLFFKDNTFANNYGGVIYVQTNPCYIEEFKQSGIHFYDKTQFLFLSMKTCASTFKDMDINYIRTVPTNMMATTNITVFPGQPIIINSINITDYFGHETHCTATPYIYSAIYNESAMNDVITLQGKRLLFIQSAKSIETSLFFTSKYEYISTYSYQLIKIKCPTVESYVNVTFRSCPLGYVFDPYSSTSKLGTKDISSTNSMGTCQKSMNDSNLVYDKVSGIVCIRHNYWYGRMDVNITAACSLPYCMAGDPCPITGYTDSYYRLPWTQDEQCNDLYGGFLCRSCTADSVFTFGASKCLPNLKCQEHWQPYLLLVLAIGGQVMITTCMILLKPVTKMGIGYLYGPLFFLSVYQQLPISHSLIHSQSHLDIVMSVYQSILLLDLSILGKIPWCFFQDVDQTLVFSLRFLGPFVTFVTMLLISLIARMDFFLKKFNKVFTSPIQPMCLLMLLSFWSLSNISIEIIKPIIVAGQWRFGIQPEYKYLENPYAIVLWCIAVILIVLVYLPFIIILFLSQILRRKVNLFRIEPFLDAFQSTFRNSCHWYSGVYLLSWLIANMDIPLYYFIIVFSGLILLHVFIQPHKERFMNVSDALILMDIFLLLSLSFLCDSDGNSCKGPVAVINYPLLLLPLLYILVGGVWLLFKDLIRQCATKLHKVICHLVFGEAAMNDDETTTLMNHAIVPFDREDYKNRISANRHVPVTEIMTKREPLIYDD